MEQFTSTEAQPGIQVHVLATGKFKTVRIKLFWRWPLAGESATAAALLPMVLRRGCAALPTSREIAVHLEALYGASFGADISKIGETQIIEADLEVADSSYISGEPDLLRAGLAFLRDVALRPLLSAGAFSADYTATEKGNLRRRIEGIINDKPRYALNRLLATMCTGEPFAIGRYGRLEDLDGITPQDLAELYYRLRASAPADVYVVGNVVPEQAAALAAELYAVDEREPLAIGPAVRKKAGEVRYVHEDEDVAQANLAIGLRSALDYNSDDYPALLVYNGILGAFPHSKLFVNVREKHSLAYFASSRLETTKGLQYIVAGIDSGKYDDALALIQEQIADTKEGRFSPVELTAAQKSIVNGLLSMQDDAGYIIDAHMGGLINGRERRPEDVIAAVQAVRPEDVVRAATQVELDTVYFLKGVAQKGSGDHDDNDN